MLMLPVARFVTEATLGLLVLVVIIIIPGMVLMLDPELLPVLGLELMPALELLVPPPDIRPGDITVPSVAIPSDMPCIAAFAAPKLFGART